MVNEIVSGISKALHLEFGDNVRIYTQSVEQGFSTPCFFIEKVRQSKEHFLGKRYFQTHAFCIHYFATNGMQNEGHGEVLERLYECLEMILVENDLYRGEKMSAECSEGVLHFFIHFDTFVKRREEKAEKMDAITSRIQVKE